MRLRSVHAIWMKMPNTVVPNCLSIFKLLKLKLFPFAFPCLRSLWLCTHIGRASKKGSEQICFWCLTLLCCCCCCCWSRFNLWCHVLAGIARFRPHQVINIHLCGNEMRAREKEARHSNNSNQIVILSQTVHSIYVRSFSMANGTKRMISCFFIRTSTFSPSNSTP